jgi:hypothetical protein
MENNGKKLVTPENKKQNKKHPNVCDKNSGSGFSPFEIYCP